MILFQSEEDKGCEVVNVCTKIYTKIQLEIRENKYIAPTAYIMRFGSISSRGVTASLRSAMGQTRAFTVEDGLHDCI